MKKIGNIFVMCKKDYLTNHTIACAELVKLSTLGGFLHLNKIKSNEFIRENAVQFEIILEYVAYHCHDFFVTQDIVNLQMDLSVIPCSKDKGFMYTKITASKLP